jgi:hypothetical protein
MAKSAAFAQLAEPTAGYSGYRTKSGPHYAMVFLGMVSAGEEIRAVPVFARRISERRRPACTSWALKAAFAEGKRALSTRDHRATPPHQATTPAPEGAGVGAGEEIRTLDVHLGKVALYR